MSTQAFAGVVAFSGDVALVQLPPSFSALTSNYYAFLFKERSGYVIPDFPAINPLIPPGREFLSVSTPGNYGLDPRIPRHLPPGTVVDTYVLYFDPIGENIFSWSASGAFSFDQEILGIQLDNQYSLIGEILDLPGLETSQFNSWLEPSDCVSEPDICDSLHPVCRSSHDYVRLQGHVITRPNADICRCARACDCDAVRKQLCALFGVTASKSGCRAQSGLWSPLRLPAPPRSETAIPGTQYIFQAHHMTALDTRVRTHKLNEKPG